MNQAQRRIQFFDERAVGWDEYAHHDESKIEAILDLIVISTGSRVLDVGCGNGILAPFLINRIGREGNLLSLDVSPRMIEVARGKHRHKNIEFLCDDIQTVQLKKNNYNTIILYSMFPHIDYKQKAISRCAMFLKPGGRLCICHSDPRYKIIQIHKRKDDTPVSGDEFPPTSEVVDMVENAGLKLQYKQDDDDMFVIIGEKSFERVG